MANDKDIEAAVGKVRKGNGNILIDDLGMVFQGFRQVLNEGLPLLARLGLRDRAGHQCRRRHVDVILSCFPALFRVGKCKKSEIFQELNLTFAVPGGILSQ